MQALIQIQAATVAARNRLDDKTIATEADGGKIRVVRVTYPNGSIGKVAPVSEWMPVADVCKYLETVQ